MKLRRIFAMLGVIILAAMYILTLVFSLMQGALAFDLFRISVLCTIIIPILLYVYGMFYKYFQNRGEEIQEDKKIDSTSDATKDKK